MRNKPFIHSTLYSLHSKGFTLISLLCQRRRSCQGFTLIELLVVIAIMAILGVIFTNTVVQSLRGQNKIKVIDQVKQNGQVVLDRISTEVRQAEKIICFGDNQAIWDTIIFFKQNTYTRIRFYAPQPTTNPSDNGYVAIDYPVSADSSSCIQAQTTPLQNLSDRDTSNGVSLDFDLLSEVFAVNHQAGYADTVTIQFRATSGVDSGKTYENMVSEGGVLFTTTVQIRGGKI